MIMRLLVFSLLSVCASFFSKAQNVGIGTTIPNHPLTVAADGSFKGIAQKNGAVEIGFWTSSVSAFLQTWTPHDLHFATNDGATRLTLAHATGYFGVNTHLPSAHLDVNGTFRLRGNGAAEGHILVSNIDGVATWRPFSSAGGWSLTGNGGTNPAVNFLGTTDNQPLMFRHNNTYAGRFHYGLRNYFIGNQAGIKTVAPHNIAIGDSALLENISGYSNVAIGSGALQNSEHKSGLVAIGDSALFQNATHFYWEGNTGIENTAVGSKALSGNSSGFRNTAVGFEAGSRMGLGKYNTILGARAMRYSGSSEAEHNVAIGYYALDSTIRGFNTAVGSEALRRNMQGDSNVVVGFRAMQQNKGGKSNTAFGTDAMKDNVSGSSNTVIGARSAVQASPSISFATAIGAGSLVTRSFSVVLGANRTSGSSSFWDNVGIGTTAPVHALDIQTNSVFNGIAQLRLHETEGDYARMKFTNTATGAYWDMAAAPSSTAANAVLNFYFSGTGDLLSLRGNGNATLLGTLTQLSDARLKQNIKLIPSSLNRLLLLNGYQYHWKGAGRDPSLQLGVLAQEIEKYFPELVTKNEKGMLSVNYIGLVPVVINAMKEQQQKIDLLEKRLIALEKKVNR